MRLNSLAVALMLVASTFVAQAQVSDARAIEAFTCAAKSVLEADQTIKDLYKEGHFIEQNYTLRSGKRYAYNGICLTDVMTTAARGHMIFEARSCASDIEALKDLAKRHFPEQASDSQAKAEGAFFMRKRGADALMLSGDPTVRGSFKVMCFIRIE